MEIKIPFMDEFRQPMILGKKTVTSRNKKYGEPKDTFKNWGIEFRLEWIDYLPLAIVASNYYREEGFNHPDDFVECWGKLHPRKGFIPDHKVYMHKFKRLSRYREYVFDNGKLIRIQFLKKLPNNARKAMNIYDFPIWVTPIYYGVWSKICRIESTMDFGTGKVEQYIHPDFIK